MQTSQNDVHTSSDKLDPYYSGFLHYSEGTLKNMGPVKCARDITYLKSTCVGPVYHAIDMN